MLTRREALVASGAAGIIAATAGTATAQSTFKLPEKFSPREVRVDKDIATNTIIIVTGKHFLYHVGEKPGTAVRYGVGVGRAGLEFKGSAVIGAKKRMAQLDTDQGHDQARTGELRQVGRWNARVVPEKPVGRTRIVSVPEWCRHLLPHPRHHGSALDRNVGFERLHPHDQ